MGSTISAPETRMLDRAAAESGAPRVPPPVEAPDRQPPDPRVRLARHPPDRVLRPETRAPEHPAEEGGTVPDMASIDEAARTAMDLPQVAEGERRGNRTWSVAGKAFAWERPFSKADIRRFGDATPPDEPILAVRVEDLGAKEAVLEEPPKGLFTIPHFDGYPAVLIELKAVTKRALREAIIDGWLACAPPTLANEYVHRKAPRRR